MRITLRNTRLAKSDRVGPHKYLARRWGAKGWKYIYDDPRAQQGRKYAKEKSKIAAQEAKPRAGETKFSPSESALSALEIYVFDPAHDQEEGPKGMELRQRKLFVTDFHSAMRTLTEAANSADDEAERASGSEKKAPRGAATALTNLVSFLSKELKNQGAKAILKSIRAAK
jgi:hypothetical protein